MYRNPNSGLRDQGGTAHMINGLMDRESGLSADISFLQQAVNGQSQYMRTPEEKAMAPMVANWFSEQRRLNSYHVENFPIPPERVAILAEIEKDKNRVIKDFLEIIARRVILEQFRRTTSETVKVFVTSAHDDVFGGVDCIVQLGDKGKERYYGIDVAVSDNQEYLEGKGSRSRTYVPEFFAAKGEKSRSIDRLVFPFSPTVMAKFTHAYIHYVKYGTFSERGRQSDPYEAFLQCSGENVREFQDRFRSKVSHVLQLSKEQP